VHRRWSWPFQAGSLRIVLTVMGVLQRILPRGLYWRAALILLVPIVTIQLVVSTAFIQRHYEGVTRQMTNGVAIDLQFLLAEIEAAGSPEAAMALVAPLGRALEVTLTIPAGPAAPVADRFLFLDLSGQVIVETLRSRVPGLVAADVADPERVVNLAFNTSIGPVQAQLSRRRMSATNPHQLLVLMIFTSLLMTGVAFVFLRNQLKPITRLAEAAEDFGKGRTVPYRPRGALEVRAAGRAFLDMRARIERQIEQRTLMLSGVSHDLRTPLTRLRLGLALMPEDPEVAALLADVQQMERMVDEFLAFVRGDAMEGSAATDAVALVGEVVDRAGPGVRLVGVEGTTELVEMRPQAVARAVENLVSNARRYAGKVEVRVEFQDHVCRVTVEDDGPGIPEFQREQALRPFTRLGEERDPNLGGGVGLGLSIASDIALSHGGALRLSKSKRLGGLRADLVIAR
jgi:two-component system, OmpR family, osmolarity sensor histidine kinase EnvZ